MVDHDIDILIIGGGVIGAMLMLALAPTNLRCLLVDNHALSERVDTGFDARSIALSTASVRILQTLGVWPLLEEFVEPIHTIHVSEQGRFGHVLLESQGEGPPGYVVEIQHINRVLAACLDQSKLITPAVIIDYDVTSRIATIQKATTIQTIHAKLVVAADGAHSTMRNLCRLDCQIQEYDHQALVTNVGLARDHHQVAYERFTATGPLALLPMRDRRAALVWSLLPHDANRLMLASDTIFLRQLHQAFGYRLGRFLQVGQRVIYPLKQVSMPTLVTDSVVFIGNAANTLHPVAGQGFNLGLRDVAMLAQCIIHDGISAGMLSVYEHSRQDDQALIKRFTGSLVKLFTSQYPGLALARSLGLFTFDNIPPLKSLLARYTRGFAGVIPDLVCGIPLSEE